jgi:hypothetical protein
MIVGIWLIVSPWFIGYPSLMSQAITAASGLLVLIVASIYFFKNRKRKPTEDTLPQLHAIILALGIASVIEGVTGAIVFEYAGAAVANEIVAGILLVCLSGSANQIISRKQIGIRGEDGSDLIVLTKLERHNKDLLMKAKAFGTMPMVIKVEPSQLWLIIGYLSFDTIAHIPSILMRGQLEAKKSQADKTPKRA